MSQSQVIKPKRAHSFLLKLILLLIVCAFVGVIVFKMFVGMKTGEYIAGMGENVSPVTAVTVEPTQWTPVIETTGLVRPNQGVILSSQASGTIKRVLVNSGQQVKKGDLLVELDNAVEIASLKATEAQLPSVRSTYQRYANLIKSQSVSQTDLDTAKAAYEQLMANIQSLKATIERRQIVAPFDGVAGIVKVNEGQYVITGTEIVRVEDISLMKIDFAISQNQLEHLFIGQKVTATADARLGETFGAKITAIEPAINSATGLIDVQATFDEESGKKLLSGMFTRLRIALPTEYDQIVVPQIGVSYNMYGEMSYILTALSAEDKEKIAGYANFPYKDKIDQLYRVKQVTVFTKDRQGIYAQLKGNDIKVGDKIVTGGMQSIGNGSLVILTEKEGVGTTAPASKTNL